MSKIFEAALKHKVIPFEDIYPDEPEEPHRSRSSVEHPISAVRPISPLSEPIRVARLRTSALSPLLPFDQNQDHAAEQYRIIRTKLLHEGKKSQLVLVSSPSSGDGKTLTSINIAGALALKSESSVLLIDADLRRPSIAKSLNLPVAPGLTDVLQGTAELDAALIRAEQFPNLFILPSGSATDNPSELLDCSRWRTLLDQVRQRFHNVVVDAPPVAVVADFELLQVGCDGVLLVMRPDYSDRTACMKAIATVAENKFLGIVLNCVDEWWLWRQPAYASYRRYVAEQVS